MTKSDVPAARSYTFHYVERNSTGRSQLAAAFCTGWCLHTENPFQALTSRNFWLISFRVTWMPDMARTVAMPLPISPPPSTATLPIFLGLRPKLGLPG